MNRIGVGNTLDVKRCYLPGVVIRATCHCGQDVAVDLGKECLSFPPINEPFRFDMDHETPDGQWHEFHVLLTLRFDVTVQVPR